MRGIGAMLSEMGGNKESVEAYTSAMGKKIEALKVDGNRLHIWTDGGVHISLYDDGQSCCESRYMSTDDDLSKFIGATLGSASTREVEGTDDAESYRTHDQAFLVVETSAGSFTVVNHNEHNGYYGGFSIRAQTEGDSAE